MRNNIYKKGRLYKLLTACSLAILVASTNLFTVISADEKKTEETKADKYAKTTLTVANKNVNLSFKGFGTYQDISQLQHLRELSLLISQIDGNIVTYKHNDKKKKNIIIPVDEDKYFDGNHRFKIKIKDDTLGDNKELYLSTKDGHLPRTDVFNETLELVKSFEKEKEEAEKQKEMQMPPASSPMPNSPSVSPQEKPKETPQTTPQDMPQAEPQDMPPASPQAGPQAGPQETPAPQAPDSHGPADKSQTEDNKQQDDSSSKQDQTENINEEKTSAQKKLIQQKLDELKEKAISKIKENEKYITDGIYARVINTIISAYEKSLVKLKNLNDQDLKVSNEQEAENFIKKVLDIKAPIHNLERIVEEEIKKGIKYHQDKLREEAAKAELDKLIAENDSYEKQLADHYQSQAKKETAPIAKPKEENQASKPKPETQGKPNDEAKPNGEAKPKTEAKPKAEPKPKTEAAPKKENKPAEKKAEPKPSISLKSASQDLTKEARTTSGKIKVNVDEESAKLVGAKDIEIKGHSYAKTAGFNPLNHELYDISLLDKNGKKITEFKRGFEAEVLLPVRSGREVLAVKHFLDPKDSNKQETLPSKEVEIAGQKYRKIKVSHFSVYGIEYKPVSEGKDKLPNTGASAGATSALVILMGLGIAFFAKKR